MRLCGDMLVQGITPLSINGRGDSLNLSFGPTGSNPLPIHVRGNRAKGWTGSRIDAPTALDACRINCQVISPTSLGLNNCILVIYKPPLLQPSKSKIKLWIY